MMILCDCDANTLGVRAQFLHAASRQAPSSGLSATFSPDFVGEGTRRMPQTFLAKHLIEFRRIEVALSN